MIKEKALYLENFSKKNSEFIIKGNSFLETENIHRSIFQPENKEKYTQLIKEYNIPQIGICENVTFNNK